VILRFLFLVVFITGSLHDLEAKGKSIFSWAIILLIFCKKDHLGLLRPLLIESAVLMSIIVSPPNARFIAFLKELSSPCCYFTPLFCLTQPYRSSRQLLRRHS
jgi:hypothetical protein